MRIIQESEKYPLIRSLILSIALVFSIGAAAQASTVNNPVANVQVVAAAATAPVPFNRAGRRWTLGLTELAPLAAISYLDNRNANKAANGGPYNCRNVNYANSTTLCDFKELTPGVGNFIGNKRDALISWGISNVAVDAASILLCNSPEGCKIAQFGDGAGLVLEYNLAKHGGKIVSAQIKFKTGR